MPDVTIFKVERLTEGGFVTYAPGYSQFSETLELAHKRLVMKAEQWTKDFTAQLAEEKKEQQFPQKR
jgi:hypothetical protein